MKEDKQLLLKDLCARLPYGVECQFEDNVRLIDGESSPFYDYTLSAHHLEIFMRHNNFHIKPYLRPMSSMTEEEQLELSVVPIYARMLDNASAQIDWLNAHHFDYRGLIKKGLAIEVTENNNPYKN